MLVLFLLAALAGASAGAEKESLRLEKSAEAMGTAYSVVVYGDDRVKLDVAVEGAFDELQRLDELLSNFKPGSEWSEVNRDGAERPVRVSSELFQLLSACQRYSRESEGAFDISVGPLMKLWGFYKGNGRLPHRAEVQAVMARIGYRHVDLDAAGQTVRFDRKGVELDPGGIGKGYAVDRMLRVLKDYGITTALVSGGGSSIYALGAPPSDARGWKIDIKDPKAPGKVMESVYLKNESLSTSGSYEKFFRAEGRIFSHIMDPRTGYPAAGMLSVSVIAPQTIDSEVWAKPFFINGRAWSTQHKPKGFRAFLCEDRTEQACAWLQ